MAQLKLEVKISYSIWYYIAIIAFRLKLNKIRKYAMSKPLATLKCGNTKSIYKWQ